MSTFNTADVKNAILDCVLDRYNNIPAENEIEYTFSQKFEKWGQKLIKKTQDKQLKTNARFSGRTLKLAIIVAALIAALTVTAMAVPAIREAILDFFLSDRGESYGITFDPEQAASAPHEILEYHIPQYAPDGYTICAEDKTPAIVTVIWVDDIGNVIVYNQNFIPENSTNDNWIGINSEDVIRSSAIISGYKVEIITEQDVYTAVWTDNMYLYMITLPNSLDLTVFEQMLNSITIIPE